MPSTPLPSAPGDPFRGVVGGQLTYDRRDQTGGSGQPPGMVGGQDPRQVLEPGRNRGEGARHHRGWLTFVLCVSSCAMTAGSEGHPATSKPALLALATHVCGLRSVRPHKHCSALGERDTGRHDAYDNHDNDEQFLTPSATSSTGPSQTGRR